MPPPKGSVSLGAALANSFRLEIPIIGTILFVTMGELDQTLTTITLADQTVQTTGTVEPVETDATQYAHHTAEVLALTAWWEACKLGATGYKQAGILHMLGSDGNPVRSFLLTGMINKGRKVPAHDAKGDGEGQTFTWKFSIDDVTLIG